MALKPIHYLLVDTSAFIKLSQLHEWSDSISTVSGVIAEIRNRDSRMAIASLLPYKLSVNNPGEVAIKHVVDFAKKTGDFPALSRTDLELIAATYELECIHGVSKGNNLNSEPKRILEPEPISYTKIMSQLPAHQIGFYNGKPNSKSIIENPVSNSTIENSDSKSTIENPNNKSTIENPDNKSTIENPDNKSTIENPNNKSTIENPESIIENPESTIENPESTIENPIGMETADSMEHSRSESNDSSEDEQGWITPYNLSDVTTRLGGTLLETPTNIPVGCLTSDYAIQNVLLQMGLQVISTDGLRVTQLRTYALQCRVCTYTIVSMETERCPKCGYDMLIRVQATTSSGMASYQALSVKQFSKRGLRYSTPKPTGGRHGNVSVNPRNKPRYSRKVEKVNPLDADYIARESPFKHKDVNSRGANIGFKMGSRNRSRNPNEVAKKGTRKKQARI